MKPRTTRTTNWSFQRYLCLCFKASRRFLKQVFVQNLPNEDEFDLHENKPIRGFMLKSLFTFMFIYIRLWYRRKHVRFKLTPGS